MHFRTPWDVSWGFVGAAGGPLQRGLKGNKSFTKEIAEVLEQLPCGQGKRTINGAQSRPPGERCGIGYFYPATTEGNERGWSSGCGNERWREWRQPDRSMKMWGPGGGQVTGGTSPPSPRAAAPCAPWNTSPSPPSCLPAGKDQQHQAPLYRRQVGDLSAICGGGNGRQGSPLTAPVCALPPPQVRQPPEWDSSPVRPSFSPSSSDLGKRQGLGLPAFKCRPACFPHPCRLQDSR